MIDAYEKLSEFALIETIRNELGDEVEACPGFLTREEAEPLNRVFRAIARRILAPAVAPGHDLSGLVSSVLRRLVGRRLPAGELGEFQARILLELEPGTPDDWLTFVR